MKKIYLLFLTALCLFGANAQVLLTEDFSTGTVTTPPAGWNNSALGTTTDLWHFDNPGARVITGAGFSSPYAIFDSDKSPTTSGEDGVLESPTFDASTGGSYLLEFDQQLQYLSGTTAEVQVWNGTAWVVAVSYTSSQGYTNPAIHTSIDITTFAGSSAVAKVRFRYAGSDRWWWAIDNVKISKVACLPVTGVSVSGITDTDANVTWSGTGSFILEYGPTGFTPGTEATAGVNGTVINPATSVQALSSLTPSTAYQVYVRQNCTAGGNGYSANSSVVSFSTPSPAPVNDICSGAITIPVASTCTPLTYSTAGATDNNETGDCTNGTETAVWFKFIATQTIAVVTVTGSADFDAVIGARTSCGSTAAPTGGDCTDETISGEAEVLNLSGLTIGNTYYIQVYDYQGDASPTSTFDICVVSSSCGSASAVSVGSVTSASATVSWTSTGTSIVEYGPAGFTPGTGATAGATGTVINPATSPQVLSLTASTNYDVYVRQVCAGPEYSFNTPVVSFSTPCAAENIPYTMPITGTDDFDLPSCTSAEDVNGDFYSWYTYDEVLDGWTGPFLVYEYNEDNGANDWLYTNGLNLTGGTTYRLTFKYNNDGSTPADAGYYPEKLKVSYGTSPGAAAMTNTLADYPTVSNATPQIATIDFTPSTSGVYYIGFQAYSDANQYLLLLDDISVDLAPACGSVSGVAISNITSGGATATWTGGAGAYILEYGPAGFTPGTGGTAGTNGTVIDPATSAQVLTGLTQSTTYDVYVRKNCTATSGGYSINSPVVSFTTTAILFISATSGNWSAPGTWVSGVVPTCSDNVFIATGHTVTVNSASNLSSTLTINAGATLAVTAGDVTVGCTNRNSRLVNNGTLNVSGGSLVVNGSVFIPDAASFSQSGGIITVDGNNGGAAATSVPAGTPIFAIGSAAANYSTGTISLTGGTILITDPHAATGAAFIYYGATNVANNITAGPNHILKFGDGVSTDAGGAATGFILNEWEGNSGFKPNLTVDAGTGTNRKVISQYSPVVFGNLTILSGEFAAATRTHVERDLTVSGTGIYTASTASGTALFMSAANFDPVAVSLPESASPNAQTINGNGTIRNSATTVTANVVGLTIINSNPAGVTLNRPMQVSGTYTNTAGNLNTSTTNLLTVGTGTTAGTRGTFVRTAGMIVGPVRKFFSTATGTTTFPIGNGTSYKPAVINFTAAPTAGGTITALFSPTAPVFGNAAPLNEGALVVNYASTQGSWFLDATTITGGTYTSTFTGTGATDVIDYTKTVLIKRPSAGGDWTLNGTHVTTTGSNTAPVLSRTGMSGFSEFAIGGQTLVALPIKIEYFRGATQGSVNVLDWKVNSTDPSVTISLERSADGRTFGSVYSLSATAARCLQPFDHTDADPLQVNYYRLKITDVSGKVSYSQVVVLLGKGRSFELIGLLPNPVLGSAQLNVTSASSTRMEIRVTDIAGKTISNQTVNVIAGANKIPMNFSKLASGTYQVTGKTADGAIRTIRFVKQ